MAILIYVVHNKLNGKVYIGQTILTVLQRFNGHLQDSRNKSKNALHCALRKYGEEAFEVLTLCTAENQEQADRLERLFIFITKSYRGRGYNMTTGGKGGWMCSDELCQK